MNLRTLFWLSVITGCLMAPIVQGQSFTFDGYKTSTETGYQTYLHWGTEVDHSCSYVETPIEVKNMIWGSSVTAQDITDYNVHYSIHHADVAKGKFNYHFATQSEFTQFEDSSDNVLINTELDVNQDGDATNTKIVNGQLDVITSLDYLLNNGATQARDPRTASMVTARHWVKL